MSCLFRRGNGIYYVVTLQKGRRVWQSLKTRTESEARRAFDTIETEQQLRTSMPLSLYADEFLAKASLNLSGRTIAMHAQAFKNLMRICNNRPIKKISPLHVDAFKLKRAQEVAPVSVNIEIRSLRAAFAEARRLKLIEENPFEGVKQVRVPYKEAKYPSEPEFSHLLDVVEDTGFRNLITFAVFTMMRLGEIVNLRWIDVDLQRRCIHVRSNEGFRVKGGKPRTVPMNTWICEFLGGARKGDRVFCNRSGRPLQGQAVSRRFKRYVRTANLDDAIHFHSLRHTGISWLINKGVAPQFVQHVAGDSSLAVTQIYSHVEDKNLIAAVDTFDSRLTQWRNVPGAIN